MENLKNMQDRLDLRREIDAALKAVAEKVGAKSITIGNKTRYDDFEMTGTIKVVFVPDAKKREQDEKIAKQLGLPEGALDMEFRLRTKVFRIAGFDISRPKNCIKLKDQNGKGFVSNPEQMREFGMLPRD